MIKLSWKELENYCDSNPQEWVSSGVNIIDTSTKGYLKKELTVICGATGNGKSLLSFYSALMMARNGSNVLYFSLENNANEDGERIKNFSIDYGNREAKGTFWYFNNKGDSASVDSILKEIENEDNIDAVFIDSIDFITEARNSLDNAFQYKHVLEGLCDKIRHIAIEKNIAIIVTSQLNRGGAAKDRDEVGVSDIQGSYGVVQKASHVWIIQRRDWVLKCAKSRGRRDLEDGTMMLNGKMDITYCGYSRRSK